MPLQNQYVDRFDEIFDIFDKKHEDAIMEGDFQAFLNYFALGLKPGEVLPGYDENSDEEQGGSREGGGYDLTGVKYYDKGRAKFIWDTLDLKKEGRISKSIAEYAIRGLSGRIPDFMMKLLFRALDTDHDGRIDSNEMRMMHKLCGSRYTVDGMMSKIEQKLGHEVTTVNYPTFFRIFKQRRTGEDESAYDAFQGMEDVGSRDGCCLLI